MQRAGHRWARPRPPFVIPFLAPGRGHMGNPGSITVIRNVSFLLALILFSGCTARFEETIWSAYSGPALPRALYQKDPEPKLREQSRATDGCAFAGTWVFEHGRKGAYKSYTTVFEVKGERFRAVVVNTEGNPRNLCLVGGACTITWYFQGTISSDGRSASGKGTNPKHGSVARDEYQLAEDGLTMTSQFSAPKVTPPWLTFRKVKAGRCNETVQYVDEVARWAKAK